MFKFEHSKAFAHRNCGHKYDVNMSDIYEE